MAQLKYGIVGTGAIGGYYGAMLARGGKDVHFLLRSDYEHVRKHGLSIQSAKGDFALEKVNAYRSTTDMPKCDIVFVCIKTTGNERLAEILPPLLHERTWVVMIQNGIGVEKRAKELLPDARFASGTAFICSGKTGPGRIHHQDLGLLQIAPYAAGSDETLAQAINDLKECGVEARLIDYKNARWRKCVWNIPFNGLTVVMNSSTLDLVNNSATEGLVRDICAEVVHAANACGADVPEKAVEDTITLTKGMIPYSPSMKLDFDNGRPMEIQYLYTNAIAEAKEHGAEMPLAQMLERQLRFIEARLLRANEASKQQ